MESQPYIHEVRPGHLAASVAALQELVDVISIDTGAEAVRTLRVCVGHLDHAGFLTSLLHGFTVPPLSSPSSEPSTSIDLGELKYAIIINHDVATQVRTALASIATYLARRQLMLREMETRGLSDGLHQSIADADADALRALDDALRQRTWREAAAELRERAVAASVDLKVRFASPLFSADDVRERIPVMRHVYNEVEAVRSAIDKVAGVMSAGMSLEGNGASDEILMAAQELLDLGQVRRFTAHVFRDAAVCGNGYLQIDPPPSGPRLLRPEGVMPTGTDEVRELNADGLPGQVVPAHVLHLRGMHQPGSPVGVSLVEPFVMHLSQLQLTQEALQAAVPAAELSSDTENRRWAASMRALAEATEAEFPQRVAEVLGGATRSFPDAPADLYFEGQDRMSPAADRIELGNAPRA